MTRQMAHRHPGQTEDCVVDQPPPIGWRAVLTVIGLVAFLLVEIAAILAIAFAATPAVQP